MSKREILHCLAKTLNFSKTRQKYPSLSDSDITELLLEASSHFEAAPVSHKLSTSNRLTFYIDGASRGNPGRAAIGVVVMDGKGHVIAEKGKYIGETTNNMAEYQSLIDALIEGKRLKGEIVHVFSDSELLVRQINGIYRVRDSKLINMYTEAKKLIAGFKQFSIDHVTRDKNSRADSLANEALDSQPKRV